MMEEVMHVGEQGFYKKSVYCETKIAFLNSLLKHVHTHTLPPGIYFCSQIYK